MLRLHYKGIPKSHCYPCTKKSLKHWFDDLDNGFVHYQNHYWHEHRFFKNVKTEGVIIASIQTPQNEKSFIISLYSFSKTIFTEKSAFDFAENILPKMHTWLLKTLESYPLGMTKHHEILIEFFRDNFIIHELKPK